MYNKDTYMRYPRNTLCGVGVSMRGTLIQATPMHEWLGTPPGFVFAHLNVSLINFAMSKNSSTFSDIDDCTYLGCKATPNKFIARVKLPDDSVVHAWTDTRPAMPVGTHCSVEHKDNSEIYNLYC